MNSSAHQSPIRAAVFADMERAETAVQRLLEAGFSREEITVLCSDESKERHFGALHHHEEEGITHTDQGATVKSGLSGGLLGGLVTLAGVATTGGAGIVAVGTVLGGGIAGTLVGLFVGRGVEDELARFYEQAVEHGHLLVAVGVADADAQSERLEEAARLLKESGAEPIALDEG